MRQHKFCSDKQQYNNAKPFPVYILKIYRSYYECFKIWCMNLKYVPDVLTSE